MTVHRRKAPRCSSDWPWSLHGLKQQKSLCGWQPESDQCHQIHGAKSWTGRRDRTRVPKSLRWAILFGMHLFWSVKMWGKRDFCLQHWHQSRSAEVKNKPKRLKDSLVSARCTVCGAHVRLRIQTAHNYLLNYLPQTKYTYLFTFLNSLKIEIFCKCCVTEKCCAVSQQLHFPRNVIATSGIIQVKRGRSLGEV